MVPQVVQGTPGWLYSWGWLFVGLEFYWLVCVCVRSVNKCMHRIPPQKNNPYRLVVFLRWQHAFQHQIWDADGGESTSSWFTCRPAFDEGQEEGGAKEDEEGQIHVPEFCLLWVDHLSGKPTTAFDWICEWISSIWNPEFHVYCCLYLLLVLCCRKVERRQSNNVKQTDGKDSWQSFRAGDGQ